MRSIYSFFFFFAVVVASTYSQSSSWSIAAGGPVGGRISKIRQDASGKLFAYNKGNGKLHISTDGGSNWSQLSNAPAPYLEDFMIDGSKLILLTQNQFFVSTDGGATWPQVNSASSGSFDWAQEMAIVPSVNAYLIAGVQGAGISMDGGVSWKKFYNGNAGNFAFSSTGDIYIADPAVGIVKHPAQSTINGWDVSKWQTVYLKEYSGSDFVLNVGVNLTSNNVFITYRKTDNTGTLIKYSTNGGTSWTALTPPNADLQGIHWFSSLIDSKLFLTSYSQIYDVVDGTTPSFALRGKPGYSFYGVNEIFYKASNEVYVGIDGDGIWKSNDGLLTWSNISGTALPNAIATPLGRDVEIVGANLLFVGDYGAQSYWYSSDNGASFSRKDLSFVIYGPYRGKVLKKLPSGALIANTSYGTQLTSDGINWGQLSSTGFNDYAVVGTSAIYGFSDNGVIKKSTITNNIPSDFTTTVSTTGLPASYQLLSVIYNNGYFFMALHNNSVSPANLQYWRLNSATFAATQIATSLSTQLYDLGGICSFNNKLYIGDYQQIAVSSDQGSTFTYLNYNHQRIFPVLQKGNALGVSNNGAFVTTADDGKTWSSNALPIDQAILQSVVSPSSSSIFAAGLYAPLLKSDSIVRTAATSTYIDFGWSKLNGPYGGGGRKLFATPSGQLFADAFFAVHRYNSAASSWETLESMTLNNHGFFIDGSGIIYQTTYTDLFKSTDNGSTFVKKGSGYQGVNGGGLFKDTAGNVFVLTNNGLFRSTDDGSTFASPATANSGSYYEMTQAGSVLLTSKISNGAMSLQRSTDNGATWAAVNGVSFPNANRIQNVLAAIGNNFFVVTSNDILKSTDGALTWSSVKSNISETSFSDYGSLLFFDGSGNYYFYVVGYPGKIYISSDQGATWTVKASANTNALNDIRSFLWVGSRVYAYSSFKGISFSDDGGATFSTFQNDKGLTNYTGQVLAQDGRLLFASENELLSSADQGNTWTNALNEPVGSFLSLQNGDLIAYRNSIIKSTDRGATWTTLKPCCNYFKNIVQTTTGFVAFGNAGSGDNKFYSSGDLINWAEFTINGLPGGYYDYIAALGDQIFVGGYSNTANRHVLYRVSLATATQLSIANDPTTIISYNGKVLVFSSEGSLYQSSDGNAWTKYATPAGNTFIIANNGYLFVTGDKGLAWVSRDNGASWQNVSATNFAAIFTNFAVDLSSGYAYGTARQRGVLKSANIVIPNPQVPPTVTSLLPNNNATNVVLSGLKLVITLNQFPKGISGKKIKLFNVTNITTPVEIYDASSGTFSGNSVSFTPTVTLNDLTTYFVTVDQGAFTDIFGNAFAGIINSTDWRFTTLDATAPTITFTTSNLDKGVTKELSIGVTDNANIAEDKIKIYYRGITTQASTSFQSAALTVSQGTGTPSVIAKVIANEAWYDAMGLEFYFEAQDLTGNKTRLPAGADYFYSYINYPAAAKPKISGLPVGGTVESYKIVSIPFKLADTKISTQFDELGPADKSVWRMLTYAGNNAWNDVADGSLSTIERGKGYWLNVKNFSEVFLEGASTPENNRNSFISINLKTGWNQIGNPYPVSISWNEVIASNPGIGQVKVYSNGAYTTGDVLGPYEGGFVYVSGAAMDVKVRFQGITSGGRKETVSHDIDQPTWELPVVIEQGALRNELAAIGMNPQAGITIDQFDEPILPTFSGLPQTNLVFQNQSGPLNKDIVDSRSQYQWDFYPVLSQNGVASLQWRNDAWKNSSKELFLLDQSNQILVNMKETDHYTFDAATSKTFRIYFGDHLKETIKPTALVIGQVFPNPVQRTIHIPVTLDDQNQGATVLVEIFDNNGRRVQSFMAPSLPGGFHTIQTELDESLGDGLYLVKTSVNALVPVQRTTKIIVNK